MGGAACFMVSEWTLFLLGEKWKGGLLIIPDVDLSKPLSIPLTSLPGFCCFRCSRVFWCSIVPGIPACHSDMIIIESVFGPAEFLLNPIECLLMEGLQSKMVSFLVSSFSGEVRGRPALSKSNSGSFPCPGWSEVPPCWMGSSCCELPQVCPSVVGFHSQSECAHRSKLFYYSCIFDVTLCTA